MKRIHVRLDDIGGVAMPKPVLESVYISDMEFEPEERRQRIMPDGTVELDISREQRYMVHAKLNLPLYGNIWVTADNEGEGYTDDFVDFISEAARTYLREAKIRGEGIDLSVEAKGHIMAAEEFTHLANRGVSTAENRLFALSHAIYAAEDALFESAKQMVYKNLRIDLMMGCNFFRYTTAAAGYAKLFVKAFNYATLPFYPARTVPEYGSYDYGYIDKALDFLLNNNIEVKGHPLWFGHEEVNPGWLFGKPFGELRKIAQEIAYHHVREYKGYINAWDAMNEAHDWANCFQLSQPQLIDLTRTCCDALHEANSGATAIVNICLPFAEYVAGRYVCYGSLPERIRSPLSYIRALTEAGVEYDVTGIQLYFPARDMVMVNRILDLFASLGKPLHITEMGVNGGTRRSAAGTRPGNTGSNWPQLSMSDGTWRGAWNERKQAEWMEMFYTIAASRKDIGALTWWDFIEPSFSGNGAFMYEDENPREIYFRLLALRERIQTH